MTRAATETRTIRVRVNGREFERAVEARKSLADFLREDLDLTGTHVGCEHGVCGVCTVVLDGAPVRSCLLLAVQADGSDVLTVEGLAPPGGLHPLQEAFWAHHGLQCGFCTPGVLMSAYAFLQDNPAPLETEIREMLAGSLCRCTGYEHIVDAIKAAAKAWPPRLVSTDP
ncbi:MAG: (2Fe-2S)-binding protein [Candidatus Rokubacteria bacterium]|nr:(2Fe-2S)-binding protein [Candidatus Rokubacteria bacterium]